MGNRGNREESPLRNTPARLLQLLLTAGMIDRSSLRRRLGVSSGMLDALISDMVGRGWLVPAYTGPEWTAPASLLSLPPSCRSCPLAGPGSSPPGVQRYLVTPAGRRHLEAWLSSAPSQESRRAFIPGPPPEY